MVWASVFVGRDIQHQTGLELHWAGVNTFVICFMHIVAATRIKDHIFCIDKARSFTRMLGITLLRNKWKRLCIVQGYKVLYDSYTR